VIGASGATVTLTPRLSAEEDALLRRSGEMLRRIVDEIPSSS
jgi:hypothetical protein